MIESNIRNALKKKFTTSKTKRIFGNSLFKLAKAESLRQDTDMAIEKKLLQILKRFADEGAIKLPSEKGESWDFKTKLPLHVTLINTEEDEQKRQDKLEKEDILNNTSWEPVKMIPIIHSRTCPNQLDHCRKAKAVNDYLLKRPAGQPTIPARERALRIFGDEKALDKLHETGLFSGRISLKDLDCVYCPEPMAFHPFSLDDKKTKGRPLLLVENANTYQSCRLANEKTQTFAAIVYGKGSKVTCEIQVVEGIPEIEEQLKSCGIWYFGDLDPTGLAIPGTINKFRGKANLSPLQPAIPLYRALIAKGYTVPYRKTVQAKFRDREWAIEWLGEELAELYLEQAEHRRWPQEGLSQWDFKTIFMEISEFAQ